MANKIELVNFWGKSSSHVGKHFGFRTELSETGAKNIDKTIAVCRLCGQDMSYKGGTTNLSNHLRNKHKELQQTSDDNQGSHIPPNKVQLKNNLALNYQCHANEKTKSITPLKL